MNSQFTLDPFSTIVKLALLPYMDNGVKIGICHNSVVFFQPTAIDLARRWFQSWTNIGCTRNCLFHLRTPIERAVLWYKQLTPDLFSTASDGLGKLKTTYESGNALDTLTFAIQQIQCPQIIQKEDIYQNPMLKKLMESWTPEEVHAITEWFRLLKLNPHQKYIIRCIDEFIAGKEQQLHAIIRAPCV